MVLSDLEVIIQKTLQEKYELQQPDYKVCQAQVYSDPLLIYVAELFRDTSRARSL